MQPYSPRQRRRTGPVVAVIVAVAAVIVGLVAWRLVSRHRHPGVAGTGGAGSSGQGGSAGQSAGQSNQSGSSSGPVQVTEVTDVRYGPASLEVLDVYMNKASSSQPAVVMVHGGGWSQGDKRQVAK